MSITGANYERVMALDAQGLTNAEIAAKAGVSKRTVSRMLAGQWRPPAGPSTPLLGRSPLTGVIEEHMEEGWTLDELTVLARDNDPFRQDRSEGHKLGQWLRGTLEAMGFEVGEGGRTIHNRGLHYLLIGQVRPDGRAYQNDEKTWKWLTDRVRVHGFLRRQAEGDHVQRGFQHDRDDARPAGRAEHQRHLPVAQHDGRRHRRQRALARRDRVRRRPAPARTCWARRA